MSKEDLIYDLIFSNNTNYKINILDFISDQYKYDSFVESVKDIMSKSKVSIIKERITVDSNSIIWEIKVKK